MKNLTRLLFQKSIELNENEFSVREKETNWIGNPPATILEIRNVEEKFNVSFPKDYKSLLLIANGFKTCCSSVEPSFLRIEEVDFFRNIYPDIVEMYQIDEIGEYLNRSLIIAGKDEEQHFLLIPPKNKRESWRYWKFANWIPAEQEFKSLREYLESVIDFLIETVDEKMSEK